MKREGEYGSAGKLPELTCIPLGDVNAGEAREDLRRKGPANAFVEGEWHSNTPPDTGGISGMSECKNSRGDGSDPEQRPRNSVDGYPQAAAVGIFNNPSAAFVDNPRRGVGDLRRCGCTAPRKVQLVREKGGLVEEKKSEACLTNPD